MKPIEITLNIYEEALGFKQSDYDKLLASINEAARNKQKYYMVKDIQTFKRQLTKDGYRFGTVGTTNIIFWDDLTEEEIKGIEITSKIINQ